MPMIRSLRRGAAALLLLAPSLASAGDPATAGTAGTGMTDRNVAIVRAAFDAWAQGRGSVFDLLADDVVWTVAGDSPVSGTYRGRADFLERAVQPITARLATPIVPRVEHVVAAGDDVVVFWHGSATARDGGRYANHYAWRMTLADGRIVRATAFLDTWALVELMR